MYTWTSFEKSLPALKSIEFSYQQYQSLLGLADLYKGVLDQEAMRCGLEAQVWKERVIAETAQLEGDLCFWHFPFYPGDFIELSKGLYLGEKPVEMDRTKVVRDRFRQFIRTAPDSSKEKISGSMSTPRRKSLSFTLLRKLAARRQQMTDSLSLN